MCYKWWHYYYGIFCLFSTLQTIFTYVSIIGGKYIFRAKLIKKNKKTGLGFLLVFIFWVFFFGGGLGFLMPALVPTHRSNSNTAICQLVTSARVVLEIIHLAQHKHNGSRSTRWDAWAIPLDETFAEQLFSSFLSKTI